MLAITSLYRPGVLHATNAMHILKERKERERERERERESERERERERVKEREKERERKHPTWKECGEGSGFVARRGEASE